MVDTKAHSSITIDGQLIQAQALKIAAIPEQPDFKASAGWLNSFLTRHNISYKKYIGEVGLVDKEAAAKYQQTLKDLIKAYSADDIYNADETALMYRATPTYTYEYKGTAPDNIKVQKERLSILFCSNMSGSDKMKPVVIGKFENRRCFKNINRANLPVYYRFNNKAWMTTRIFDEWLTKINKQFKAEKRHILIFLDNFSGHKQQELSNVKIEFFPANMTSVLQPMDQGIIASFKMKYRSLMMKEMIEAIEYSSTLNEIDVLNAINKLKVAWDSAAASTVSACFRKGGFKSDIIESVIIECDSNEVEFERLSSVLATKIVNFDKYAYRNCDDLIPSGEIYSDDLVALEASEPTEESEQEQPDIQADLISKQKAIEALNTLQQYFMNSTDDCNNEINSIFKLIASVQSKESTKQSKITSFFCLSN